MAKEVEEVKDNGEVCGCECHKHGPAEKGMCQMGSCPMSSSHEHCGHGCVIQHVWKVILAFVGAIAIFWIGLSCGEFRSEWNLDHNYQQFGNQMYGADSYGGGMMYRVAYPVEQQIAPAVTIDREATSSAKTK